MAPKRSQKITINFSTFVTGVKHTSWCLLRPSSTALQCTVLYCSVLYGIAVYCTAWHYTVLHCSVLYCKVRQCHELYSNVTVQYSTLHCTVQHYPACTAPKLTELYFTEHSYSCSTLWPAIGFLRLSPGSNKVCSAEL